MDPDVRVGYLFVLLAAALWALITPASRYLLEAGVGAVEIAFWRCAVAWPLFATQALSRRRLPRIARGDLPGIVALGLLGIAALYVTLPLSVAAGGAALASVLLYTAPAWVALLSWPLLGERFTRRTAVALAMTLVGVAALAGGAGVGVNAGAGAVGWGLASGFCYASLYLFGKVYLSRYHPAVVFGCALPVAVAALLTFVEFSGKTVTSWIVLLVIGVLSTYGAYLAYAAGVVRLAASRAAITATLEPVLAALLAFAIWGERFSALGYAGAVLVIAAVLYLSVVPDSGRASSAV